MEYQKVFMLTEDDKEILSTYCVNANSLNIKKLTNISVQWVTRR